MKDRGELIELEFQIECIRRGFIVSSPYGDNQKYDFIVDNGEGLSRVQVKSSKRRDVTPSGDDRYHVSIACGSKTKTAYTDKDIDVYAIYIIPESVWYFVPVEITNRIKTINLYPHREGVGRYEACREFWDYF